MNTVIFGQNAEVSKNIPSPRSTRSAAETPPSDSFSDIFATVSGVKDPHAEQAKGPVLSGSEATQPVSESQPLDEATADLDEVAADDPAPEFLPELETEAAEAVADGAAIDIVAPEHTEVVPDNVEPEPLPQAAINATAQASEKEVIDSETVATNTPQPKTAEAAIVESDVVVNLQQRSNGEINGSSVGENSDKSVSLKTTVDPPVVEQSRSAIGAQEPESGLAKNAETITLRAFDSVSERPIAYRLRIGDLSPAQQEALREFLISRQLIDAPVTYAAAGPTVEGGTFSADALSSFEHLTDEDAAGIQTFFKKAGLDLTQLEQHLTSSKGRSASRGNPPVDAPLAAVSSAMSAGSNKAVATSYSMQEAVKLAEAQREKLDGPAEDDLGVTQASTGRETGQVSITSSSAQISHSAVMAQIGLSQKNTRSDPRPDLEMRFGAQPIGLNQSLTEATFRPAALQGPEVVQRIAAQLSGAFASKGERKVDVVLNPKELGRVKMQLATSESGVRVMIQVERSETGDLMRRHIEELEKEFQEMGFENISFSFSSDDSHTGSEESETGQSAGSALLDEPNGDGKTASQTPQPLNLGGSGLDMRV